MLFVLYLCLISASVSTMGSVKESCYHRNGAYVCLDDTSHLLKVKDVGSCHTSDNLIGCSSVWKAMSDYISDSDNTSLGSCLTGCQDRCVAVRMDSTGSCSHLEEDSAPFWSRDVGGSVYVKTDLSQHSLVCDEGCIAAVMIDDSGPCDQYGCALCNFEDKCILCHTGYYLTDNLTCSDRCDLLNCQTCLDQNYCLVCKPGHILGLDRRCTIDAALSVECSVENCRVCLESNKCAICNFGYILSIDLKCQASPHIPTCSVDNCIVCAQNSCIICEAGYYVDDLSKCSEIISSPVRVERSIVCEVPNCKSCLQADKCSVCNIGFILDLNAKCQVPCLVANCLECESTFKCGNCSEGYHLADEHGSCFARQMSLN